MAAFPWLFTVRRPAPTATCPAAGFRPSADAWFGYDVLGRDVYARSIYGARASIVVAVLATLGTVLLGGAAGMLAGYRGGWLDALLSRFGDVFFGLPFVLGAIVILTHVQRSRHQPQQGRDHGAGDRCALVVLGWPVVDAASCDPSVLSTKQRRLRHGRPGAGRRPRPDHLQAPAAQLPRLR